MSGATAKTRLKTAPVVAKPTIRTQEELIADMRAHGREVGKTKQSAIAFLQRAGIVTASGKLAKPYRG